MKIKIKKDIKEYLPRRVFEPEDVMKKLLCLIPLFLLAFMIITWGCHKPSEKTSSAKIVRLNIGHDVNSFDPRRVRDLYSMTVMKMLYEGLTRIGKDNEVVLSSAEKYTVSNDLKTYTFTLRDAEWSNGDKVKAEDFVSAWKKVLDPNFPSDNAFQLYVILNAQEIKKGEMTIDHLGIRVIDDKTFEVELENPTPFFLRLLAHPVFFPINNATENQNPNWADKKETLITNGPFYLKDWRPQDVMEMRSNLTYWDKGNVKLDGIQLTMVTKEDTEFMMYEKNELDWAGSPMSVLPIDTLKSMGEKKQLHAKSFLLTSFLRMNVEKAPFYHPDMRKAFAMVINREEIVEHVLRGGQLPAYTLVPPSFNLTTKSSIKKDGQEEAKDLFIKACRELGYMEETFPEIVYTYVSGERAHLVAQAIQQQWQEAFGVKITLEAVEGKVSYSRLSKHDYQLMAGSWVADFEDPINFLEVFKHKKASTNNTQWESAFYTKQLDRSSKILDQTERYSVLADAETKLLEDLPIIPVYHGVMLFVKKDSICDVVLSSLGSLDFKWANIETKSEIASAKD